MKRLNPAKQCKTAKQTNQTKVMIPMQMRNENMIDPAAFDLVIHYLDLRAFSAIKQ
jgi:hypothetical protein